MKKIYQLNMLTKIQSSIILLITSFFLTQTYLLPHLIFQTKIRQVFLLQDIIFYSCTLLQIGTFLRYLLIRKPIPNYSTFYQFIILPIYSILFYQQDYDSSFSLQNIIRICIYLVGWIFTFLLLNLQNSPNTCQQDQSLMKISIKWRTNKLVKNLFYFVFIGFNVFDNQKICFNLLFVINIIGFYIFLSSFSFQNCYHQYLIMIGSLTAIISAIDFFFFNYGYSSYNYIGQIFFLISSILIPQLTKRLIQWKYQIYGLKNVQTKSQSQLLAILCIMKQIILNKYKSLNYSFNFENFIHILFQKMISKYKIYSEESYSDELLIEEYKLSEEKTNFIKLLQHTLKDTKQYQCLCFFLLTLIKIKNYQNKSFWYFYYYLSNTNRTRLQQLTSSSQINKNIFTKIQLQILYQTLIQHISAQQKQSKFQKILQFYYSLEQLKSKIKTICKKENDLINCMGNLTQVCNQKYQNLLIERFNQKQQIQQSIKKLNNNLYHIYSGCYLLVYILYKLVFQREKIVIKQDLLINFVISSYQETKKKDIQYDNIKKVSIIVVSIKQKGLIINQNQIFKQNFNQTFKKASYKSKKYISQLLLSSKQTSTHQREMQNIQKFDNQLYNYANYNKHEHYQCFIFKNIIIKSSRIYHNQEINIKSVIKTKINTKLQLKLSTSQQFICSIQILDNQQNQTSSIKITQTQLKRLKQQYVDLIKVIHTQTVNQLSQTFTLYQVQLKQTIGSFFDVESQQSIQESTQNISQNIYNTLILQNNQEKKLQKLQQIYRQQKKSIQKIDYKIIPLIILMVLMIFLSTTLVKMQQFNIKKLSQYIKIQQILFQNMLLFQKLISLELLINQMIDHSIVKDDACYSYSIPSLKNYLQQQTLFEVKNSSMEVQQLHLSDKFDSELLADLFDQNSFKFYQYNTNNASLNYMKFVTMVKSFTLEYLTFNSLNDSLLQHQNQSFNHSKPYTNNQQLSQYLYKSVRNQISTVQYSINILYSKLLQNYQETYSFSTNINFLFSIGFCLLSFIIFFFLLIYLLRLIKNNYQYIEMLKLFSKSFIKKRNYQMEYILNQFDFLQKDSIEKISLNKSMDLTIKNITASSKTKNLQELQKQSQLKTYNTRGSTQRSISLISSNQIDQQRKRFLYSQQSQQSNWKMLSALQVVKANKYLIIIIFLLFLLIPMFQLFIHTSIKTQLVQNNSYQNLLNQISQLIISFNNLIISQWLAFDEQQIYTTKLDNTQRIKQSILNIQKSKYKQYIYQIFNKQTALNVLFQSYCAKSSIINSNQTNQCNKIKSGILNNGFIAMEKYFVQDYQNAFENNLTTNMRQIKQSQACQKLVIFVNYTKNVFQYYVFQAYSILYEQFQQKHYYFKVMLYVSLSLFFSFIVILAYKTIRKGKILKVQICSIDSKQNLSQGYQKFRSLLNQTYYKDDSQ